MTKTVKCPACENLVIIPDDAQKGDIVECHGEEDTCCSELEIISLNPLQIVLLEEEK